MLDILAQNETRAGPWAYRPPARRQITRRRTRWTSVLRNDRIDSTSFNKRKKNARARVGSAGTGLTAQVGAWARYGGRISSYSTKQDEEDAYERKSALYANWMPMNLRRIPADRSVSKPASSTTETAGIIAIRSS